jgi:nucleotide-binding universal stress UspA family protein
VKNIVVGVDGSEGAAHALGFAIEEAKLRGVGIRAVGVWNIPAGAYAGGVFPTIPDVQAFETSAAARLDATLDEARDAAAGVEIERVLRQGQPAEVLVELARDADLLVIGSRGLGGFRGLLLGSVGQQCAQHAPCPVVIVPHAVERES